MSDNTVLERLTAFEGNFKLEWTRKIGTIVIDNDNIRDINKGHCTGCVGYFLVESFQIDEAVEI